MENSSKSKKENKAKKKEETIIAETLEEKLYSRNFKKWGFDLNPFVSFIAIILIFLLTVYTVVSNIEGVGIPSAFDVFENITFFVVDYFDWVFIFATNFFIILGLYLAFSKLGRIRIGGLKTKPEFTNFAWYSMLISAGMGIGLMFYAVSEPLSHSMNIPPIYQGDNPQISAMASTFLHWGLHPWAIYAIMALSLSYFAYNKKLPLSLRSIFYPVFKERVFGRLGDVIDLLAVLATLFGLATSLGLGVQQMNSGLNFLIGVPYSVTVQVILIVMITAVATLSIISGIQKGVRFLSEMNMRIAAVFMILVLIFGPTLYILRLFASSLGQYFNDFFTATLFLSLEPSGAERDWQGGWTIFYWAWWISWSPFVGMFIARVSKGRTIRELITAVLIIPSLLSFFWLSVFGGTAFSVNAAMNGELFNIVSDSLEVGMFEMFYNIDYAFWGAVFTVILSFVATLLVTFFFITSSDSGSVVVNAITSGGKTETKPRQRVFWAGLEGFVAALLLIIGGEQALEALQYGVIMSGLPFAIVLFFMSIMLLFSLQSTYKRQQYRRDVKMVKEIIEEEDIIID